jgi:hypothetical protein
MFISRHRILYTMLVVIVVGVAGVAIYLDSTDSTASATTTSTSSTSTTTTTTTTTTVPPTTTTLPPTTEAPTTTSPPTTAPPTTLPPTTLPPPDRALVPVVVSSGPSNGQRLAPATLLMGSAGWTDIRPLTGSVALTETVVYYVDGMEAAAELLAADTGVPLTSVAPMSEAPPVAGLANAQLLYYFGGS